VLKPSTIELIIHDSPVIMVSVVAVSPGFYSTYWVPRLTLGQSPDSLSSNLQAAADAAREIKSVLDHLGRSQAFLERLIAYGAAISEVRYHLAFWQKPFVHRP
jgi:hypothetical protein